MDRIALADPDTVRRVIADVWLSAAEVPARLGDITLREHQVSAARRLRALLLGSGGALLCDEVGLGKTYVALAVARTYTRPLVVAPSSLRGMWLDAAQRAHVGIAFVSMELLSRSRAPLRGHDLVIVDEAHHFRNRLTARYDRLAQLIARSKVLLLSATPLHNTAADMTSLVALFAGSRARAMAGAETARYVVRRSQGEADGAFPTVHPPRRIVVADDEALLQLLLSLPAPTPPRDGGIAAAIVTHTLVRVWASSNAALREAVRRRMAKAVAISQALAHGRYPSRQELAAWSYADGAMQLGFAEILTSTAAVPDAELLASVDAHLRALTNVLASLSGASELDERRVSSLRKIRRAHGRAKIVVFSQFAETVAMYYRGLARDAGTAMLTSRGARIASGAVSRREALERFAPLAMGVRPPGRREEITLLIATDLLSEGVNLQDASVVVHLDLPWTAATLEQRVGRVARLNSPSRDVSVYSMHPPASSERLLRAEAIIRAKAALAQTTIGSSRIPPLFARPDEPRRSEVENAEAIRRELVRWRNAAAPAAPRRTVWAAVTAERTGILALATVGGQPTLIAGSGSALSEDLAVVRETISRSHGRRAALRRRELDAALDAVRAWMEKKLAAEDTGISCHQGSPFARRITGRLARYLAGCPRHERLRACERVAALHRRLRGVVSLGIERELDQMLSSARYGDDVLAAMEKILGSDAAEVEGGASEIRAVIVLRPTLP